MRRSEFKLKPPKKPLRDVSNKKTLRNVSSKKKSETAPKQNHGNDDHYSLDLLLLVQSQISSNLQQIDGLVVDAFKLESMGEAQKKEIKSFTHFLSDTLDSLKLWVPRFQTLLGAACEKSSNPSTQVAECDPAETDDENYAVKSPEVVKMKSLVSPSPLVSWRDNCTVQRAKRLFLLTPLPKSTTKSFLSKQHNSVKSVFERFGSPVGVAPRFCLTEITRDDLFDKPPETPLIAQTSKSEAKNETKKEKSPECKIASTSTFSFKDCSMLVMTPQFKMSPPKSCVLLEPGFESSSHYMNKVPKSTLYPAQLQHISGSEMSLCSSQVTEDMALKYPELAGIDLHYKLRTDYKEADASLSWFMSPPKTCVLMEPSDKKNLNNLGTTAQLPSNIAKYNEESILFSAQNNDVLRNYTVQKSSLQGLISNSLIEGTPMWKNLESQMRSGKHPGENTLKKELWTKFEAASSNEFSFNVSIVEDCCHKGFLDRLEEVSGEETTPSGIGLKGMRYGITKQRNK
uniref:Uncharacterized protein n=1 Tax=Kalanchoe fedtschenkoi TaxID=63787 RepID=A0A7N0UXS2_KALFE